MEAKNLKEIIEKVADAALDNPQFLQLYQGVSTVLSYLESEQDKRKQLTTGMAELAARLERKERDDILVKERLDAIKERSDKNGRLLGSILTGVIVGIIMLIINTLKK